LHAQHIFAKSFNFLVTFMGYRLQFAIPRTYFVYSVCLCTGQHCSYMYAWCTVSLLVYGAPGECYYNTLLCCKYYLSSSSVISHAFSALCVYSKLGHHPHPLGHLSAKFCFFSDLRCWATPWRKTAYSMNQSLTQLMYSITQSNTRPVHFMPRKLKLALRNDSIKFYLLATIFLKQVSCSENVTASSLKWMATHWAHCFVINDAGDIKCLAKRFSRLNTVPSRRNCANHLSWLMQTSYSNSTHGNDQNCGPTTRKTFDIITQTVVNSEFGGMANCHTIWCLPCISQKS